MRSSTPPVTSTLLDKMFRLLQKRIVPIAWLLVIHLLLLFPKTRMPEEKVKLFPNADKVVHFGFYFGMVFTLCMYLFQKRVISPRKRMAWGICITLLAVADGIVVEFLQRTSWINRDFDWFDAVADSAGALAGVIAAFYCSSYLSARRSPLQD